MSRLAYNSFFGALAGICATGTSFLSGIIVARALGVEGSGIVAYALWLGSIGLIFADAGFSHCISRYGPALTRGGKLAEFHSLTSLFSRMLLLTVSSTALLIGIVASVPFLSANIWSATGGVPTAACALSAGLLWGLVGASSATAALSAYYYAYLRGLQKFSRWAVFVFASSLLQLAAVSFGSWKFGVVGGIAGYLFGSLPSALASLLLLRRAAPVPADLLKTARRYTAYAWGSTIVAAFVWARIEVFILEQTWGSEAVGIFTAALAMSNLATQGPVQLSAGLLPHFAEQTGRNDSSSLHASFQMAMRLIAFLVFPCCLGMAAIMPALLPLLYGSSFATAVPAAIVMVVAATLTAPGVATANLLYAKERTDIVFFWGLFGAVMSLAAGFLLVPIWGPIGAACSRAFIQVVLCVTGFWFIGKRLNCSLPYGALMRLFLAAGACASVAAVPGYLVDGPASLLIAVPVGIGTYILAVWLLRPLPPGDLEVLGSYTDRFGLGLARYHSAGSTKTAGKATTDNPAR